MIGKEYEAACQYLQAHSFFTHVSESTANELSIIHS